VGYWQADLQGLDHIGKSDRAEMLVDYLGVSESQIADAIDRLMADGEKNQNTDPFKLIIHSAKIGDHATDQLRQMKSVGYTRSKVQPKEADTCKKGKVNYEENKTHDGSAISLDRHSDGATG
jgi:hypothetical protein